MNELAETPLILLAAGKSSRLRSVPKGLVSFGKKYWLLHQMERFKTAGGRSVYIVLGYRKNEYFSAISWLKQAREKPVRKIGLKIQVVINARPSLGQFSSIQAGLAALGHSAPGALVLPIDVPCPGKEVFKNLLGNPKSRPQSQWVSIPVYRGRGGHPLWASSLFFDRITGMSPKNPRARLDVQFHRLKKGQVRYIKTSDPEVCINLNRPEDWETFQSKF